jgi:hypothetical protein
MNLNLKMKIYKNDHDFDIEFRRPSIYSSKNLFKESLYFI